jgi:Zn-dependent metalloprotease
MMKQRPSVTVKILFSVAAAVLAIVVEAASESTQSSFSVLTVSKSQDARALAGLPPRSLNEHPWANKGNRLNNATILPPTAEIESKLSQLTAGIRLRQSPSTKAPAISDIQRAHVASANMQAQTNGGIEAHFDGRNGTVSFLKFPKVRIAANTTAKAQASKAIKQSHHLIAQQVLSDNRVLLKLTDPVGEMALVKQENDSVDHTHIRYQQTYRGIPIFGKQLLVHLDDSQNVYQINGRYEPSPHELNTVPSVSVENALAAVYKHLGFDNNPIGEPQIEFVIYALEPGTATLAHKITIATKLNERWCYLIDAHTGLFIHRLNEVQSVVAATTALDLNNVARTFNVWAAGSQFYLIDPTLPSPDSTNYDPVTAYVAEKSVGDFVILDAKDTLGPQAFVTSATANTWDPAAVSALNNTKTAYQYFLKTFNRQAIDGKGGSLIAVVHAKTLNPDRSVTKDNATWNGHGMNYGDGEIIFGPLPACLDVAAHEMTHGVTEHSAALVYERQSGALNESFSDIFGAMVDRSNWLMGENCVKVAPGYMRNMRHPDDPDLDISGLLYHQPAHMSQYKDEPLDQDGGGVHLYSGIPNRAAYLIAEGLTAEGLGASIGREKAEQIFYHTLTTQLTSYAQFVDARKGTISSAETLYPNEPGVAQSVARAWDLVGVVDNGDSPSAPTATDPVVGDDVMAYLSPVDGVFTSENEPFNLYLQKFDRPFSGFGAGNIKGPLNDVPASQTRPAIVTTKDPKTGVITTDILYVGADGDIHITSLNTADLSVVSRDKVGVPNLFHSIAVSPAGKDLAFTIATANDISIHVLDIQAGKVVPIQVLSENYQQNGAGPNTIIAVDSIAFDYSGRKIVFDALNCIDSPGSPCAAGGGYRYWTIGMVDIRNKTTQIIFPAQPPGFDVGNPVFAANSQNVISFDVIDTRNPGSEKFSVWSYDVRTADLFPVYDLGTNGVNAGSRPSFWGEDDFETFLVPDTAKGKKVVRVSVNANGQGSGTPVSLNPAAVTQPTMHRTGVRQLTGSLSANVSQLDFVSQLTLTFKLTNSGNSDVTISNIAISNPTFHTTLSARLVPRDGQVIVPVTFEPGQLKGTQTATMTISSDGDVGTLTIPMSATPPGNSGGGESSGGGCSIAPYQTADFSFLILAMYLVGNRILSRRICKRGLHRR